MKKYQLKGGYRKEKFFQKELFQHMERDGYICYHIPDTTYDYRLLDGIIISPDGTIFFLELKVIETYTFNMSQFEGSQIALMEEMIKRGADAFVGIYSIRKNDYVVMTYRELKTMVNDLGGVKLFTK